MRNPVPRDRKLYNRTYRKSWLIKTFLNGYNKALEWDLVTDKQNFKGTHIVRDTNNF